MKKLLFILAMAMTAQAFYAQEFSPSQQAQGYLDAKNVAVDHATGLFHYSVPIYTLRSGDFALPISLDYTAKGVRENDMPGLIDFNWSLNVGGVVTRTVRGGIADEDKKSGYMYKFAAFNVSIPPGAVHDVNERKLDGECDIFTAVLGGRSVHFIIMMIDGRIVAEPLERINVRIKCEYTENYHTQTINGWVITDENGCKYYFRHKEYSKNVESTAAQRVGSASEHTSSWYISRIEPANGDPVVYNYKKELPPPNSSWIASDPDASYQEHVYNYGGMIQYGKPIKHRPMNYSKYKGQIDDAIKGHMYGIQFDIDRLNKLKMNLEIGVNMELTRSELLDIDIPFEKRLELANQIKDHYNTLLVNVGRAIDGYSKLLGIIADLAEISQASLRMCNVFNELGFWSAAHLMWECITEIEEKYEGYVSISSVGYVRSPILDNIVCGDQTATFEYENLIKQGTYEMRKDPSLKSIKIKNHRDSCIVEAQIGRERRQNDSDLAFSCLTFHGKDNKEFNNIKFEYHKPVFEQHLNYQYDKWGFPHLEVTGYSEESIRRYNYYYNVYDASKSAGILSLAKITTSNGGEIEVNYGTNYVNEWYQDKDVPGGNYPHEAGGIRTKSITFKDRVAGTSDQIKYHYPYLGELIYSQLHPEEIIHYHGFQDSIKYDRFNHYGNRFLNTGNSGVFYDYVEEEFVGKGKKTYLFFTPNRLDRNKISIYHFWMNGLPLGTATYDNNGNLKSMVKNLYWLDLDGLSIDLSKPNTDIFLKIRNDNVFEEPDESVLYSKAAIQVRSYDFYIPGQEALEEKYKKMPKDPRISFDPYEDVYRPNIKPRKNVILPNQTWVLIYGGKVLLRAQEEFRFEGNYSTTSSIDHFVADNLGTPFNKVEYFYDNVENSITPTRVVTTDSRGTKHTTATRRVGDMNVSGALAEMKERNIIAPVVKQQELADNKLLKETVNVFGALLSEGKSHYVPIEQRSFYPMSNTTVTSFPAFDNDLFTFGEQNYEVERTMSYKHHGAICLPVSVDERGVVSTVIHDQVLNFPILNAGGYGDEFVSASVSSYRDMDLLSAIFCNRFIECNKSLQLLEKEPLPSDSFNEPIGRSDYFLAMKRYVAGIAKGTRYPEHQQDLNCIKGVGDAFPYIIASYVNSFSDFPDVYKGAIIDVAGMLAGSVNTLRLFNMIDPIQNLSCRVSDTGVKLYVLSNGLDRPINYTLTSPAGTWKGSVNLTSKTHWNVQAFDINIGMLQGTTSVEVAVDLFTDLEVRQQVTYMCLVPKDCEFMATGYNPDGTAAFMFNQTGHLEWYERDSAGRATKITDQNGHTVKENKYYYNGQR